MPMLIAEALKYLLYEDGSNDTETIDARTVWFAYAPATRPPYHLHLY